MMGLIGVPFRWGGRGPDAYDCWGLLMELHRRFLGVEIPDYRSTKSAARNAVLMARDLRLWREVDARPGAAILFRIYGLGAHVGLQIDDFRFAHTWEESGGVTIERLAEWQRQEKVIGFYEYAGASHHP